MPKVDTPVSSASSTMYLIRTALAAGGSASSGIVVSELVRGVIPTCAPGFQCATVLQSAWMKPFGVSISYLGLAFFIAVILINASLIVTEIPRQSVRRASLVLAGIAGGFSLYALGVMGLVLSAWCQYCLVSGLLMLGLGLTALYEWRFSDANLPSSDS